MPPPPLVIRRCGKDGDLQAVGGGQVIRSLTMDADVRVAYYSAAFLMRVAARVQPEAYRGGLRDLVRRSQEEDDERLLENPLLRYLGLPLSAGGAGLLVAGPPVGMSSSSGMQYWGGGGAPQQRGPSYFGHSTSSVGSGGGFR